MSSRLVTIALAATTLIGAPSASWGEGEENVEAARRHFERAVGLYRDGDYEAALADFDRAYELAPHWGLLYNIGLARAALRDYQGAVAALEGHLEGGGDRIPAQRREQIEAEIQRFRTHLGALVVSFEGPSGVTLLVDGVETATSPFDSPIPVNAGRHLVELRADGYLPFRRLVIVAGGVEVPVRAELAPLPESSGAVLVVLDVPDARITLDGEIVGTSPLERAILAEPGRRVIEASRPGYETVGRVVEVRQGELDTIEMSLEPLDRLPDDLAGRLDLDLSEEQAEVFLDGAPVSDGPVPIGAHVLEARLTGFEPWWREIEVGRGEPTRIDIDLRPTASYLDRYLRRARRWRLAAWLTTAIGAAVLAADLGLYLWNRARHVDWTREAAFLVRDAVANPPTLGEDEARRRYEAAEALGAELRSWSVGLAIAAGVGAAAVAAGLALFATGPDPHRYDRFTVSALPGGVFLAFAGRLF